MLKYLTNPVFDAPFIYLFFLWKYLRNDYDIVCDIAFYEFFLKILLLINRTGVLNYSVVNKLSFLNVFKLLRKYDSDPFL